MEGSIASDHAKGLLARSKEGERRSGCVKNKTTLTGGPRRALSNHVLVGSQHESRKAAILRLQNERGAYNLAPTMLRISVSVGAEHAQQAGTDEQEDGGGGGGQQSAVPSRLPRQEGMTILMITPHWRTIASSASRKTSQAATINGDEKKNAKGKYQAGQRS